MSRKKILSIIFILLILAILISVVVSQFGSRTEQITTEGISQGVTYIQSLEAKDPSTVDDQIRLLRQQKIQAMKDDLKNQLTSGAISVWSMFEDYIIMGDSRTIGFSYYGYLPESNVWAKTGATIKDMEALLPDLYAAAPGYVYVTYGMNDFCSAMWATPEDFAADYGALIQQIHQQLPDTKVIVCSILPATEAAYARANIWSVIPTYNEAIKAMTETMDYCYYVDCDEVAGQYESLYESDGVHFHRDFYPHWATTMIMKLYDIEYFQDDENVAAA